MSMQNQIVVKTYKGNQAFATEQFKIDAAKMAGQGYFPTSQSWAPGAYGCSHFLVALLLCLVIIGVMIFIYMLFVKPDGTLSVTYELRSEAGSSGSPTSQQEKTCPRCAENIKAAAVVCRFCGHSFE